MLSKKKNVMRVEIQLQGENVLNSLNGSLRDTILLSVEFPEKVIPYNIMAHNLGIIY